MRQGGSEVRRQGSRYACCMRDVYVETRVRMYVFLIHRQTSIVHVEGGEGTTELKQN